MQDGAQHRRLAGINVMNKLVQIRSADAEENLGRISEALKNVTARRSDAETLAKGLMDLVWKRSALVPMEVMINYCSDVLSMKAESNWQEFAMKIEEARRAIDQTKADLDKLAWKASELIQKGPDKKQRDYHDSMTNSLVADRRRKLDKIKKDALQPLFGSQELLQGIENAKPKWGEHIETVAGMILRDDRFDGGLCALADQIATICADSGRFKNGETLNILGRDEAMREELKHAVYFRFPAWSVWGLALIAHEYWHASCAQIDKVQNAFDGIREISDEKLSVWPNRLVQDCLADTFATYVMGPAYAFACILLSLDVNSLQDRVRAKIVFSTLQHLHSESRSGGYDFVDKLQTSWNEATGGARRLDRACWHTRAIRATW